MLAIHEKFDGLGECLEWLSEFAPAVELPKYRAPAEQTVATMNEATALVRTFAQGVVPAHFSVTMVGAVTTMMDCLMRDVLELERWQPGDELWEIYSAG